MLYDLSILIAAISNWLVTASVNVSNLINGENASPQSPLDRHRAAAVSLRPMSTPRVHNRIRPAISAGLLSRALLPLLLIGGCRVL